MIRGALEHDPAEEEKQPHVPRRRILLIEDNKGDVVLVRRMLKDASPSGNNFEFSDAARMDEALELLGKMRFDLILLDLHLRDTEGVVSVAALRGAAPHIPVIVYSGANDPKLKEEALLCGARHFLIKGKESPFSLRFMINETLAYA